MTAQMSLRPLAGTELFQLRAPIPLLVRPDGYVGAIVASKNLKALERYLHTVNLAEERWTHA